MKTAYELAMERLNKQAPAVKLTDKDKAELAEVDSKCKAKIAEREIGLNEKIAAARAAGDFDSAAEFERELAIERRKLQADCEEKKEKIRQRRKG